MNNSRVAAAATLAGAVVGGVVGYLFFTEHGRSVRRQMEPALDDLSRELMSLRTIVEKATEVARGGWKMLNEAMGEAGEAQYPSRQTLPFEAAHVS
jgi:gas vesicle protein